jgi:hypothetical protein
MADAPLDTDAMSDAFSPDDSSPPDAVADTCQCPQGNCCAVFVGSAPGYNDPTGLAGVIYLGIDPSYIYWSGVTRAPLDGGPPTPVGAGRQHFAVGRSSLYFFGATGSRLACVARRRGSRERTASNGRPGRGRAMIILG